MQVTVLLTGLKKTAYRARLLLKYNVIVYV